ncbi:MAG: LptF/LptG family permease [Gemmataceae bacterium]|nr:LptF/LptG family permease [Gemmataceae bacterium]
MYFGTVNRMIFSELMKVFLMSLVGLTGMFLLAGLIQEATQKGLSPTQIVMAIPLIIPNTLPFTIPATTLFATCVVYGRMSADSEVLVLRAAGINIYHLLWPALLLGVLTTGTTAALYYDPIPRSQVMLRDQLLKDGENLIYGMIKREGGLRQNNLDFVLFVRDVQGRDLIDVVVKKRRPDRLGYELVARSQTAKIRIRRVKASAGLTENPIAVQEKPRLTAAERFDKRKRTVSTSDRFELVVYMDHCYVDSFRGGTAADLLGQEYTMPLPNSIFGKDPKDRASSQTWRELFENRDELNRELVDLHEEIRQLEADPKESAGPGKTNAEVARDYRIFSIKQFERQIRHIETEIQMRPALSLGCFCFVLIGCPVGIWASRSDYLSVFIICFLPTVFIYYPILLASLNLAKDFKVPVQAAWISDGVVLASSLLLIKWLMKR